MALFQQHRYSGLIRPISYVTDLVYINILGAFCFFNEASSLNFSLSISIGWTITALISQFYEVYRFSFITRVFTLLVRQLLFFTLLVFAYSGLHTSLGLTPISIIKYIALSSLFISFSKYGMFFLLKKYRGNYKLNNRNTVILGANRQGSLLEDFFEATPHLGFQNKKTFSVKELSKHELESIFSYILNNKIDEIYCSISELNNRDLLSIVNFADNNLKVVKFIPESTQVLSKKLKHDFYGVIPILSFRTIALNDPFNLFLKRAFDVVFSLMVIVFILSWLTPILAILISLESKGPVFFNQYRWGINNQKIKCYKSRTMYIGSNEVATDGTYMPAKKDDQRITTIGKFLRITSIDEMPQFFNVLIGSMSVVGPRPHPIPLNIESQEQIHNYLLRHLVKPGITGWAQINGRDDISIEKKVQLEQEYLYKKSFLFDIEIIIKTFTSVIFSKGVSH